MRISRQLAGLTWLISLVFLLLVQDSLADDSMPIVTRDQWGANRPVLEMPRHTPQRLTIHHSATPAKPNQSLGRKLRSLQTFSQTRSKLADGRIKEAWGDIPYHFYIDITGQIGEGRAIDFVGDTNTAYDPTGHVAIVLEGNFEHEVPAAAQIESLVGLLTTLARDYHLDPADIGAHKDFAETACPGANMMVLLPEVVAEVTANLAERQ